MTDNDSIVGGDDGVDTLTSVEFLQFSDTLVSVAQLGLTSTITGTPGNDNPVFGTEGGDFIDALAGDDSIEGRGGNDSVLGGAGNDTIFGNEGNDTLLGGGDDDSLSGGADDDSMLGGIGNDAMLGDDGNDLLDGGANDDTLLGSAGDDAVLGGGGNDLIIAGDFVLSEAADGNDSIVGGTGDDTLAFDAFGAGVGITVDLTDTGGQLISSEYGTDTISGIEAVVGTGLDDAIFGGNGDETLIGSAGNDLLVGGGGNDLLLGGANDDTLTIGDANFFAIDGGTGTDILALDGDFDLDLTSLVIGEDLIGLEEISLSSGGSNTLTLGASDVIDLSDTDTLTVHGDSLGGPDSIDAGGGWTEVAPTTIGGEAYSVYTQGAATLQVNDAIDQSGVGGP